MKNLKLAIVGATGMVGRKFLEVLEERNFPVSECRLFASEKSAGKMLTAFGKQTEVLLLSPENVKKYPVDVALFSAGGAVSELYAPLFVKTGAVVIDNSSKWRMDEKVPLVVPEVNPEDALSNSGIIANPNCSTIQAVVALKPLFDEFGIKRVVFSTYQAVSGAGVGGYNDLMGGTAGLPPKKFNYPIFGNCLPQIDLFEDDRYTKEEHKMINETRKILHAPTLSVTATTVRVPVYHGHSESINVEFEKPATLDEIFAAFKKQKGLVILDDPKKELYPMPIYVAGKDEVYVGRIRRDFSVESGVNFWCVADNIRKGAATNAVQIAEYLLEKSFF
ncbi:MAG: aspartate-semialdehyde dehydrogenase [Eubacteriales bacterium]|nr:aspartate-semialdehyde dehydrogenase [Faecalibacterium sp.]MDY3256050.1 aspartate-semialdehyde dehydrogenase [Eubacteriales bacterium]MDY6151172.1 aspartate-semialdehyde dehydrogenase [Eubacteriales bacterium]CCY03870.1 aspartate-semialdehyde dehydrogenase [Faecalibacterium sp. CAG:1138]